MINQSFLEAHNFHSDVSAMYNWEDVAARTIRVYDRVMRTPTESLLERFRRFYGCGLVFGKLLIGFCAADHLLWRFLEWYLPREDIDLAVDFPRGTATPLEDKAAPKTNPNG